MRALLLSLLLACVAHAEPDVFFMSPHGRPGGSDRCERGHPCSTFAQLQLAVDRVSAEHPLHMVHVSFLPGTRARAPASVRASSLVALFSGLYPDVDNTTGLSITARDGIALLVTGGGGDSQGGCGEMPSGTQPLAAQFHSLAGVAMLLDAPDVRICDLDWSRGGPQLVAPSATHVLLSHLLVATGGAIPLLSAPTAGATFNWTNVKLEVRERERES